MDVDYVVCFVLRWFGAHSSNVGLVANTHDFVSTLIQKKDSTVLAKPFIVVENRRTTA